MRLNKDVYLWKMNIKTASKEGVDPFLFCKSKNILGSGWPLKDENGNKIRPKDIENCEKLGRIQYDGSRGFVSSIHAFKELEPDDLIWTRNDGVYYLCRVMSKWRYEDRQEYLNADVVNIVDVEFVEIGTIENVPGKVINCFRSQSTIQRIRGYDTEKYDVNPALIASMQIYNNKKGVNLYDVKPLSNENILDMFLPEDVEEIISLYLQIKKNYLIYTSSNKLDTQTYEFVMTSKDGSHLCYAQVKTGRVPLDGNDYIHLTKNGDKVYLFAVSQEYYNVGDPNIIAIDKDEIVDFIYNNKAIMPQRIKMWLEK